MCRRGGEVSELLYVGLAEDRKAPKVKVSSVQFSHLNNGKGRRKWKTGWTESGARAEMTPG